MHDITGLVFPVEPAFLNAGPMATRQLRPTKGAQMAAASATWLSQLLGQVRWCTACKEVYLPDRCLLSMWVSAWTYQSHVADAFWTCVYVTVHAGMLALPKAFASVGILLGVVLFITVCFLTYFSSSIIIRCAALRCDAMPGVHAS